MARIMMCRRNLKKNVNRINSVAQGFLQDQGN